MASEQVVVRGRGSIEVEPDAARLRVEARARATDAAVAHQRASAIAAATDATFDRHGAAIRRRSTSGLVVAPSYEWRDRGRHFVGWDAARTATIEVTDPSAIGDLFAGLADAGAVAGSLQWVVDPDNAGHAEARRAAAADARARASAYTEALDVSLGPVMEIREPETESGSDGGPIHHLAMAAAESSDAMTVEAPQLRVDAEVDVTFGLIGR